MLYSIFDKYIKQTKRLFKGKPVWWDPRILEGEQYEEGFWYLISKDD